MHKAGLWLFALPFHTQISSPSRCQVDSLMSGWSARDLGVSQMLAALLFKRTQRLSGVFKPRQANMPPHHSNTKYASEGSVQYVVWDGWGGRQCSHTDVILWHNYQLILKSTANRAGCWQIPQSRFANNWFPLFLKLYRLPLSFTHLVLFVARLRLLHRDMKHMLRLCSACRCKGTIGRGTVCHFWCSLC